MPIAVSEKQQHINEKSPRMAAVAAIMTLMATSGCISQLLNGPSPAEIPAMDDGLEQREQPGIRHSPDAERFLVYPTTIELFPRPAEDELPKIMAQYKKRLGIPFPIIAATPKMLGIKSNDNGLKPETYYKQRIEKYIARKHPAYRKHAEQIAATFAGLIPTVVNKNYGGVINTPPGMQICLILLNNGYQSDTIVHELDHCLHLREFNSNGARIEGLAQRAEIYGYLAKAGDYLGRFDQKNLQQNWLLSQIRDGYENDHNDNYTHTAGAIVMLYYGHDFLDRRDRAAIQEYVKVTKALWHMRKAILGNKRQMPYSMSLPNRLNDLLEEYMETGKIAKRKATSYDLMVLEALRGAFCQSHSVNYDTNFVWNHCTDYPIEMPPGITAPALPKRYGAAAKPKAENAGNSQLRLPQKLP